MYRHHLLALFFACSFLCQAEVSSSEEAANKTPVWYLTCAAHDYSGILTGPWILMVSEEDVSIDGHELSYEIPSDKPVGAMRDGKGQTLLFIQKHYDGPISSEDNIKAFLDFIIGEDRNKLDLQNIKIHILSSTVNADGNGSVVTNINFPPGFGDASAGKVPLGSLLLSKVPDQPLLAVLGINFAMLDEKRRSSPPIYPSAFTETKSLFVPGSSFLNKNMKIVIASIALILIFGLGLFITLRKLKNNRTMTS